MLETDRLIFARLAEIDLPALILYKELIEKIGMRKLKRDGKSATSQRRRHVRLNGQTQNAPQGRVPRLMWSTLWSDLDGLVADLLGWKGLASASSSSITYLTIASISCS